MRRRHYLAVLGTAAVPLGSGCVERQHGDGIDFKNGSFESGLAHWVPGRDLPTDPNTGAPVSTEIRVTSDRASDG